MSEADDFRAAAIKAADELVVALRAPAQQQNDRLVAALRAIAEIDYRGNRSPESEIARCALRAEGLLQVNPSKGTE